MSKESRRIGREGEKRFSLLCTEQNVTCNRSEEDDFGWDKLIEFPPADAAHLPFDLQPAPVAASVQIKTTTGKALSCRLRLDNALRMAKSPLPSFVVLIVLQPSGAPRFFVRHVWEELISAWLKAGREAGYRRVKAINKEFVTLPFTAADERGDALLGWMRDRIAAIPAPYAATKAAIETSVGYEGGYGKGQVSLVLDQPTDFLDLQLGIKKSLRTTRFVYTPERFGIPAAEPAVDFTDGELFLTPEGRPGRLRLLFPDQCRLTLDAKLFSAEAPGPDGPLRGWRVATRCFELSHGPGDRTRGHARLTADTLAPADELALFAHLQATPAGAPIKIDLVIDDRDVDLGVLTLDHNEANTGWPMLALELDALRLVSEASGRSLPETSLAALDRSAGELELFGALASSRAIRSDFIPMPGIPKRFSYLLAYASAAVDGRRYAAIVRRAIERDVRRGRRRQITCGAMELIHAMSLPETEFDADALQARYQAILEARAQDGDILALGDLRKLIDGTDGDRPLTCDLPQQKAA